MTGKELIKATLEFSNKTGRAPRDIWYLPWVQTFEKENFDYIMNKYCWDIGGFLPKYSETSAVSRGDPYEVGEYVDYWGCKFTSVHPGIIGEVKEPIVSSDDEEWEDTSKIVIPTHLLSFDINEVNVAVKDMDVFTMAACCPRPFERLQFIRGTENLYVDLMLQPKGFLDFKDKMHAFYCELLEKWAKTDVDSLKIMDDWGAQRSLLINPATWRQLFKPMYKDYIDIAHKYGKKIFMHSDGYILDIIPDLVEMGLDAINSQIFCMGTENLAKFKGKITFWGEVCRQRILPYGTTEDVENAVQSVYDNLWDNGGCIAQCEYGPGAKIENVDTVYKTWDKLTTNK